MARESMMVRADQQAKYLLLNGEILDDASIRDAIEAVTTDQIKRTARTIFASPPTYAALGPLKGLPSYADVKERLNVRAAA